MTSSAALFGHVFELTRGDLENASFAFHPPAELIRGLAALRLARLAGFSAKDGREALFRRTQDFVGGLFGQSCAWSFLLRGLPRSLQCWFATDPGTLDGAALLSLLRASFAETHSPPEVLDAASLASLRYAVLMTGTPSLRRPPGEQIEQLCRGLAGSNWLYSVCARPWDPMEIARRVNETAERIRDIRANYLLKSSPIDEENRSAQRCVELLEAQLKRYEEGRVTGLWQVRCVLYAERPELLPRARHILRSAFGGKHSLPDPIRVRPCLPQAGAEPALSPLTTRELAILTRLPAEEFPGFELLESARFGVEPPALPATPILLGRIADRGLDTGNWLAAPRDDFTTHGLIAGITGGGKTNSCFWLLDQLWAAGKGVPFLVIEPAKSEYRSLAAHPRFAGLRVFTLGDETVSPLRLNPFAVPPGILIQTHIDYLKSLFSAAFVLYPPMPYVLEQSIQEVYEDRGWDVARNLNARGGQSWRAFPNLADLAAKIPVVIDSMGYDQRIAMDVKAGLLARINQLRLGGGKGRMLGARRSADDALLFEGPCILELKQIVSDDEKAFLIGLLLIRLAEYREVHRGGRTGLVHVTLIEEAHRLLRNVSTEQGSEISANPKGRAIEVFCNILSEIRAYGEGILVAEQIPLKLAPDVVKNTGLKLLHKLVSPDDRDLVGKAVNLRSDQLRRLATLETGEAVAWTGQTRKATLVRVPPAKNDASQTDDNLRQAVRSSPMLEDALLRPYAGCDCRTAPPGCPAPCGTEADRPLLEAFRHLYNTFRFNFDLAPAAFAEFRQLTLRGARGGVSGRTYCWFLSLAESEIERRGEFRAWSYNDVDWMIARSGELVEAVETGKPAEIPAFQARARQLEEVAALPFPGCRACASPCQFRFDMACVAPGSSAEFRRVFVDPGSDNQRLIEVCRDAAARAFLLPDHASIRAASFCFAVQQLAATRLDLSLYYQNKLAGKLRELLGTER